MPVSNPSPPPDASSSVRGLVSLVAQSFAGVKTFVATLIASAGIQVGLLFNTNGTGSTDNVVRVGTSQAYGSAHLTAKVFSVWYGLGGTETEHLTVTKSGLYFNGYPNSAISCSGSWLQLGVLPVRADSYYYSTATVTAFYASGSGGFSSNSRARLWSETLGTGAGEAVVSLGAYIADGSVNAAAKLLSIRTGLGGTEVEKAYFTKDGSLTAPYLYLPNASSGGVFWGNCRITGQNASGALELNYNAGATQIALNTSNGQINQRGVVSAAVGADTQNFPKGINTLASGATSVTITNSLVTANSWVDVTFHADPGGRVWVTRAAGSFTVNVSAAPGANAAFSWEVSTLL